MTNRLAIFDCDGTLVDSGATIHRALAASVRRSTGWTCPPPSVARRVIGLSLIEAMAALAAGRAAEQHVALAEDYKRAFMELRAAGEVEEPLFDGVLDLLDALEERRLAARGRDRQIGPRAQALPRAARHPCALRLAADRRPASVQAAPVDGRAGDRRRRRGAGHDASSSATPASTWRWRRRRRDRRSAPAGAITRPRSCSTRAPSRSRSSRSTCSTLIREHVDG